LYELFWLRKIETEQRYSAGVLQEQLAVGDFEFRYNIDITVIQVTSFSGGLFASPEKNPCFSKSDSLHNFLSFTLYALSLRQYVTIWLRISFLAID
jgi:hypothetical protein